MDQLFWKGNWQAVPETDYLREHTSLIEKPDWIIEGYVDKKMSDRLSRSHLVLYLDYSRFLCVWRIILRWIKHRKESRPELPKEALEQFKWGYLWTVFTRAERECIEEAIEQSNPKNLIRFSNPKELESFLKTEFI
ncbi:MAG: hypothetical protein WCF94_02325 [bacterium]